MTILGLLVLLIVVGVGLYFVPMDSDVKRIIIGVIALVVVLYILSQFFNLRLTGGPVLR